MSRSQGVWDYKSIVPAKFTCFSTGNIRLDSVYCQASDGTSGFARGAISILSGQKGLGKTRLSTTIMSSLLSRKLKVLYFENEITPSQFCSHYKISIPSGLLFISDQNKLDLIYDTIMNIKPDMVFIDSLSKVEGFNSLSQCALIFDKLREAAESTNCHIAMIAHLNKEGVIKGASDTEHMADITISMTKYIPSKKYLMYGNDVFDYRGVFIFKVTKNRFGKSDNYVAFKHRENGVVSFYSNVTDNWTLEDAIHYLTIQDRNQVLPGKSDSCIMMIPRDGMWEKLARAFGIKT